MIIIADKQLNTLNHKLQNLNQDIIYNIIDKLTTLSIEAANFTIEKSNCSKNEKLYRDGTTTAKLQLENTKTTLNHFKKLTT